MMERDTITTERVFSLVTLVVYFITYFWSTGDAVC